MAVTGLVNIPTVIDLFVQNLPDLSRRTGVLSLSGLKRKGMPHGEVIMH